MGWWIAAALVLALLAAGLFLALLFAWNEPVRRGAVDLGGTRAKVAAPGLRATPTQSGASAEGNDAETGAAA